MKETKQTINVRLISPECIDNVVSFIPILGTIRARDVAVWDKPKKGDGGELVISMQPNYHRSVLALMKTLNDNHFVQAYDWGRWSTARKLLGKPRGSSVFPPPCRAAVQAATYNDAGTKLSVFTWGIVPKIRQVDDAITPKCQSWAVEVHPKFASGLWLADAQLRLMRRQRHGRHLGCTEAKLSRSPNPSETGAGSTATRASDKAETHASLLSGTYVKPSIILNERIPFRPSD